MQHAVCRRSNESRSRSFFPSQMLRFGENLILVCDTELSERAKICVVTPNLGACGKHWVRARVGIVRIPIAGMHNDFIANFHFFNAGPNGVHDADASLPPT
jgi:hypothetical protein